MDIPVFENNGALFQFELNPDEFEVFRITAEKLEPAWKNACNVNISEY